MTIKLFLLIILSGLFGTATQIFFKKGVNSLPSNNTKSVKRYIVFMRSVFKTPYIWLGFAGVACWTAVWLTVLAQADLSLAFPFDSIEYVMILFSSAIFLHERMGWDRVIGTMFIVAGMICVALS